MTILEGKGVCEGYAFGPIAFYNRDNSVVKRTRIEDTDLEIARFGKAKEKALQQLQALYTKALAEVGETNAQIFEIHQMMLEDDDYLDSVTNIVVGEKVNAEFAVATTADNFAQMFSSMDDDYMRERAADVKDISERLIRILSGKDSVAISTQQPVILAADDLVPSETVQLDKDKILSFITQLGSANSHTAILARMMNIPAVIGLKEQLTPEHDGVYAIVDGYTGKVLLSPDEQTCAEYRKKEQEAAERKKRLQRLKGKETISTDGAKMNLYANIGGVGDVAEALRNDAEGIGLFRSEFLYLMEDDYPSEEAQLQAYKTVAQNMAGRKVIIRTLDIGADKQIGYFNLEREENPAMGYRAIRICLDRQEVFRTQLRALYRASVYGNISIMLPMITDVAEVLAVKRMIEDVRLELSQQGIAYSQQVELGIMLETPAAVMASDILAQEVDFFSVGSNDLTQYLLAVDRQNPRLEEYYRPHHIGLLRMLQIATDNAHRHGKWIGICGELAADTALTETFLALGIDELSVSPGEILRVREKIRSVDVQAAKERILASLAWR